MPKDYVVALQFTECGGARHVDWKLFINSNEKISIACSNINTSCQWLWMSHYDFYSLQALLMTKEFFYDEQNATKNRTV